MRILAVLLGLVIAGLGLEVWSQNCALEEALRQRDEARRLAVGLHKRGTELMAACQAVGEHARQLEQVCPMYWDM